MRTITTVREVQGAVTITVEVPTVSVGGTRPDSGGADSATVSAGPCGQLAESYEQMRKSVEAMYARLIAQLDAEKQQLEFELARALKDLAEQKAHALVECLKLVRASAAAES